MSTLTDNENKLYLLILTIIIIYFFSKKKKNKKKKTSLPHKDGTWYNELKVSHSRQTWLFKLKVKMYFWFLYFGQTFDLVPKLISLRGVNSG